MKPSPHSPNPSISPHPSYLPHSPNSHFSLSPLSTYTLSFSTSKATTVLTSILHMSTMIKKSKEKGWGGGKWFRVKNPSLSPSRSFFSPSLCAPFSTSTTNSNTNKTTNTNTTTTTETRGKKEVGKWEGTKVFANNAKKFSQNKGNNFDKFKGKGKGNESYKPFTKDYNNNNYNNNNNNNNNNNKYNVKEKYEVKERKEVEKMDTKEKESGREKKNNYNNNKNNNNNNNNNNSYLRFESVDNKGKGKEKEEEKIRRNIGKLINDCVEKKNIKKAEDHYQELSKLSILPSTFLLNTFLNLCRVCRHINKADEYFQSFLHLSTMHPPSPSSSLPPLTPDLYTYNIMIDTANRCKKPAKALEYYHLLRSSGKIIPDEVTFISLIKSCGLLGKPEKAEEYYKEMELMGILPSLSLFNALIHSCVSTSDLDRAEGYYQSLLQHDLLPDSFTFTSLIKACEKSGSVDQAEIYFNHMISLDISPNLICYNTIIDIQRSVRDRSEDSLAMVMTNAQRHFKAMREDWSLSPDHFTFSSLISICALTKKMDLAEKYYEMMTRKYQIKADLTVLNCLIHTASSIPSPQKADFFFHLIKSLHLYPSRTSFNSLFQTYSSYLTRRGGGGGDQQVVVNNDIDPSLRLDYFKKAEEYHDLMKRLKIRGDWITYQYLANIAFAADDLEKHSFYLNLSK